MDEKRVKLAPVPSAVDAKVGTVFLGPVRHLSIERVLAFSGGALSRPNWPDRNLHTDLEKATQAGLPGVIVSATQFEGHLIDLLVDLFEDTWFITGIVETRVPKSLMLGDSVQAKAELREVRDDGDGEIYLLDVRCENQHGEPVMVGNASCRLSRSAAVSDGSQS